MLRIATILVFIAATLRASPSFADNAYEQGRAAADRGDHREALRRYEAAYGELDFKAAIAGWAWESAVALGRCPELRKWLKRLSSPNASQRDLLETQCARPQAADRGPPPQPDGGLPARQDSRCPEGQVLTEDQAHCCPAGTTLNADKTLCNPSVGTLTIGSNLSGALLSGLPEDAVFEAGPAAGRAVPATGFHAPVGDVRLRLPAGEYTLKAGFPQVSELTQRVTVQQGTEAHASFDWETRWSDGHETWERFASGNRAWTAFGNGRAVGVLLGGLLGIAGSTALYSVCALNAGGACDTTWKSAVAYTGASIVAFFAVIFTIVGIGVLAEERPAGFTDVNGKPLAGPSP